MRDLVISVSLLLSIFIAIAHAKPETTQPAPIKMSDVTGVSCQPLDLGKAKASVIIFIATECPISNGYAPEINRICQKYESLGVAFYLVHTDPDLTDNDAKKHAADYGFTCPVLIDRKHELVRRLGAKVTPEAFVVGGGQEILYRGRIDDLYQSVGNRRFEAANHDLRDAIDAVVAGRQVANQRTNAVGCAIGSD